MLGSNSSSAVKNISDLDEEEVLSTVYEKETNKMYVGKGIFKEGHKTDHLSLKTEARIISNSRTNTYQGGTFYKNEKGIVGYENYSGSVNACCNKTNAVANSVGKGLAKKINIDSGHGAVIAKGLFDDK